MSTEDNKEIFTIGKRTLDTGRASSYLGNMVLVTNDTVLTEFEQYLKFTGTVALHYVVCESGTLSGTYTRIFERTVEHTGVGLVEDYYGTGPCRVSLKSGHYYVIAVGWHTKVNYYYGTGTTGQLPFCVHEGGFSYYSYPLGEVINPSPRSTTYHQRYTVHSGWLYMPSECGTLQEYDSTQNTAYAEAVDLLPGTYSGNIQIFSNALSTPEVVVPVTFTVVDIIPPEITECATDPGPLTLGEDCTVALPDLTVGVVATDNCCGPVITQEPASGTPISTDTLVTLTATDGAGLTDTCDVTVTISACPHPADVNEDFRMVLNEAIAYLAGWQQGSNPIGHAIRAVWLWQNGEDYRYDGSIAPPLCWVLVP